MSVFNLNLFFERDADYQFTLCLCFMENRLSDRHDGILHDSFTLSHVPGQSVIFSL